MNERVVEAKVQFRVPDDLQVEDVEEILATLRRDLDRQRNIERTYEIDWDIINRFDGYLREHW